MPSERDGLTPRASMGGHLYDGLTSVEWYTPPAIFDALALRFDLDPCAPEDGVPWVPAQRHFCKAQDGLSQPWTGRVWLNPPYGTEAGQWVARLARHGNGIALVFARTDTEWAQLAMRAADAVCFVAGRLSFIDGAQADRARTGHNAAAASMLLAYGDDCAHAVVTSGLGTAYRASERHVAPGDPTLWEAAA